MGRDQAMLVRPLSGFGRLRLGRAVIYLLIPPHPALVGSIPVQGC